MGFALDLVHVLGYYVLNNCRISFFEWLYCGISDGEMMTFFLSLDVRPLRTSWDGYDFFIGKFC